MRHRRFFCPKKSCCSNEVSGKSWILDQISPRCWSLSHSWRMRSLRQLQEQRSCSYPPLLSILICCFYSLTCRNEWSWSLLRRRRPCRLRLLKVPAFSLPPFKVFLFSIAVISLYHTVPCIFPADVLIFLVFIRWLLLHSDMWIPYRQRQQLLLYSTIPFVFHSFRLGLFPLLCSHNITYHSRFQ